MKEQSLEISKISSNLKAEMVLEVLIRVSRRRLNLLLIANQSGNSSHRGSYKISETMIRRQRRQRSLEALIAKKLTMLLLLNNHHLLQQLHLVMMLTRFRTRRPPRRTWPQRGFLLNMELQYPCRIKTLHP